ncbi:MULTISPECIES: DUF1192 family protein [unclassified Iodidimonas]|jgi:uncharacterized small protein (DUF1192 family)|uniref:DUF1192 family protein n=1 Tax=unclassified Iodidimonas TaxID=2626145 RepID=UPI00248329C9|nr:MULTISPECIES: DUF1192 family protein [unclassified Iodidimonas]
MFHDEPAKPAMAPLDALEREDLDRHSLAELIERIARLDAEIDRAKKIHTAKAASKAAADALFGKG